MTTLAHAIPQSATLGRERVKPAWLSVLAWGLAGLALGHELYLLFGWRNSPMLEIHGFRQAQTAISAYWLLHGGPFFAYETPVLGSPWSIPFELPIYQGVVALVTLTGVPMDAAGRLVNVSFLLAAFWPLRMLWLDLRLEPIGYPIALALVLAAPGYAFWSRSFMIESCALFFGVLWLALFVRFLSTDRTWIGLAAVLTGVLAMTAKATTAPAFLLLAGLYVLPRGWRWLRAGRPAHESKVMAIAAAALVLPLAGGLVWVAYSDAVKQANPMGARLTSQALAAWNYGEMALRYNGSLIRTLQTRIMSDMFGRAWPLALLLLPVTALRRRNLLIVPALLAAFGAPLLIFTNLHLVHNYYQYAISAFVIVAVALGVAALATDARLKLVAAGVFVILFAAQFGQFYARQYRWLAEDTFHDPSYQIAIAARDKLPANGSLLVFGTDGWSSAIPYYAQRKGLVVPSYPPPERMGNIMGHTLLVDTLRDPQAHLEGTQFAGVVICGAPATWAAPADRELVYTFLQGRAVLAQYDDCRLLSADRPSQ